MYTLSAPASSGHKSTHETLEQVASAAAAMLSVGPDAMVEVESPDGGTTYCYASQADADADQDGAYAVKYQS